MFAGWMAGGPQRQRDSDKCPVISDILQQKEEYNRDYTHAVQMRACTGSNNLLPNTCLYNTHVPRFLCRHTCIYLPYYKVEETRQRRITPSLIKALFAKLNSFIRSSFICTQ